MNIIFYLYFVCYVFLIISDQKSALLLKNELFLVILENFVYSVTITIFVWLVVTICFVDVLTNKKYCTNYFFYQTKIPDKAAAAESFLSKIEGIEIFFKKCSPIFKPCCNFQKRIKNPVKHLRRSIL